jgi:hypothetical protein
MSSATARNLKAAAATAFPLPELAKGERYAGVLLTDDGTPSHHLVLLPGKSTKDLNWEDAKAWAKKQGGELPTRREQSLLMANAKQHIEGRWHWSSEQHAGDSAFAWYQTFSNGYQVINRKDYKLRARAVRRVPI